MASWGDILFATPKGIFKHSPFYICKSMLIRLYLRLAAHLDKENAHE